MSLDYNYHYVMGDETKTESSKRMSALDIYADATPSKPVVADIFTNALN